MRVDAPDVLVVGAGPAGLSAGIVAARSELSVLIVDENPIPGGQLTKQTHKFFGSERHSAGSRGIVLCRELLQEAETVGVKLLTDTPVVGMLDDLVVLVRDHQRMVAVRPKVRVLATGAAENAIAFPGWTLPGVMTAGAAQTFVNVHRIRVGRRALVVGSGNVGLIVAYQLVQAGCDVAAIVEAMPSIGGWGVHSSKVARMGIPILPNHTIKAAYGDERVERVTIHEIGSAAPGET